jgi:hypothetical protein
MTRRLVGILSLLRIRHLAPPSLVYRQPWCNARLEMAVPGRWWHPPHSGVAADMCQRESAGSLRASGGAAGRRSRGPGLWGSRAFAASGAVQAWASTAWAAL